MNTVKIALLIYLLAGITYLNSGCSTTKEKMDNTSSAEALVKESSISELNLLLSPMGIDLDRDLEMDAVALQLFAGKEGKSKGVQIMQGEVKITLFDGIIHPGTSELPPVLKEWKYSSEDLVKYAKKSMLGIGYEFLLIWDKDNRPKSNKVMVSVEYYDSNGTVVRSAPGIIPLNL